MDGDPKTLASELAGLQALARCLVHGDAEADDLVQNAAVAALVHPPPDDSRPLRPWLAAVLRNRWRMDRRGAARRREREAAVAADDGVDPGAALDRARALERLASALVALAEPFRETVMRRYLDGESAADIARALGVPSATVRGRLKVGLDRLRAGMDGEPAWRRALLPPIAKGAMLVTTKSKLIGIVGVLLVVLFGGGSWWYARHRGAAVAPVSAARDADRLRDLAQAPPRDAVAPAAIAPPPGQAKPTAADADAPGGLVGGRVIDWSTGAGVVGADLAFIGDAGAITVRSSEGGAFSLAPITPGSYTLAAASAPGYLPFAPDLAHSSVHLALARDRRVDGVTIFLFPALDYHGRVVDATGAAVGGARVRLLGTPTGEQRIDSTPTEWTTDVDGRFTFHAADDAVLEAVHGPARGVARLDRDVTITKQLVIALVAGAAASDATITGRVTTSDGSPLADVLVRALPDEPTRGLARAPGFATTAADGTFAIASLERDAGYALSAEADGFAPSANVAVASGARDVAIVLESGEQIDGSVVTSSGDPVPAYTLLAYRRDGAARTAVVARSIVDAAGHFAIHVAAGDYELVASASGWAPSPPTVAHAGDREARLVVSPGATLRGRVVSGADDSPIPYARVQREARGGGASAQPANAGTVTRADGTFELTGIPAGALAITIAADHFHPRIEAGMTASDGEALPDVVLALTPLADGEQPVLELVGIGCQLGADGDGLRVQRVIAGSGAEAAGIVVGDLVVSVDGAATRDLGLDGSIARIRGVEGTTVAIGIARGDQTVVLDVMRKKLKA